MQDTHKNSPAHRTKNMGVSDFLSQIPCQQLRKRKPSHPKAADLGKIAPAHPVTEWRSSMSRR